MAAADTGRFTGRVTGIGGLFFRSQSPQALADWYRDHLGVGMAGSPVWPQEAGPTVFMPFPADSDYFAADRQWMLNLRVEGLDALLARLADAGISAERRAEWDGEAGRFARIHDPDGNPIELWEPPANAPTA
ncbi:MAG: VOC family protein [Pseudomonadota bacterium]